MTASVRRHIDCAQCNTPLPRVLIHVPDFRPCPKCATPQWITAFPALLKPPAAVELSDAPVSDGEAGCFYHDHKKAVTVCESCGRFICALCRLDFNNRQICPACLQSGRSKGQLDDLDHTRPLHDSAALLIAVMPLVLFYPFVLTTIVTGPLAIFLSIRHWNKPTSVLGRTKARFNIAILLGCQQIAGWIFAGTVGFGQIVNIFSNV